MGKDLVEIEPRELQFPFELKKQSTCSIRLVNKSNDYVAFKVKTTSPKRYCVRPNTGVILPSSSCAFTVTMQAQKSAPPDMQLKDKFLVQTTAVPFGTTEEDIVPDFFSKESKRLIEESKLRVILISPPNSPESPIQNHHGINGNGSLNPKPVYLPDELEEEEEERPSLYKEEDRPSLKESSFPVFKKEYSTSPLKESSVAFTGESLNPRESSFPVFKNEYSTSPLKESSVAFVGESLNQRESSPVAVKDSQSGFVRAENLQFSHVTEEVENLKSKVNNLELKLEEAEKRIVGLRDESKSTVEERDSLQKEMVHLRKKTGPPKGQVGFPFLFVVYMLLVGVAFGYYLHA